MTAVQVKERDETGCIPVSSRSGYLFGHFFPPDVPYLAVGLAMGNGVDIGDGDLMLLQLFVYGLRNDGLIGNNGKPGGYGIHKAVVHSGIAVVGHLQYIGLEHFRAEFIQQPLFCFARNIAREQHSGIPEGEHADHGMRIHQLVGGHVSSVDLHAGIADADRIARGHLHAGNACLLQPLNVSRPGIVYLRVVIGGILYPGQKTAANQLFLQAQMIVMSVSQEEGIDMIDPLAA